MSSFEVEQPILNSPFEEPLEHWQIEEGKAPQRAQGRRRAGYFYRDPKIEPEPGQALERPTDRSVRFQPREMHAQTDVRPVGERHVQMRVGAPNVEAIGIRER